MRKGFTLVEISIVLVIIGLLIGGILVAQSMINTAKIQRLVRDLAQYEISINNFKMNYKYYPGDSPYFTPPGNGDNVEGCGAGGCGCLAPNYHPNEIYHAFAHLTQAKMISANYVPYSPQACGGTMNDNYFLGTTAGVTAPYTELDSKAAPVIGVSKYVIIPRHLPGSNFYLFLYVSASYVLPIEAKLGSVPIYSNGIIGLFNQFGPGRCQSASFANVSCAADDAAVGTLNYYLAPI